MRQTILDEVRRRLNAVTFPYQVPQISTLKVLSVNITTVCGPESGHTVCRCEDQYSWPCDKCYNYSLCPDVIINTTCDFIYGLPTDQQYCQANTSSCQSCPDDSPNTTPPPTTATTTPPTTTATTTPPTTTTTTPPPTTTTTTPPPTTTTTTPPPPPTTTTTPPPQEKNVVITMDVPYNSSYNNPDSDVYQNTKRFILDGCQIKLKECKVTSLTFSPGSTIVDSVISASSIPDSVLTEVKQEIIKQIVTTYPVIIDGPTPVDLSQPVLFGYKGELECVPPVPFNSSWRVDWYRGGTLISMDSSHSVNNANGKSVLTIDPFYRTDTGYYECRVIDGNNIYRQTSTKLITFKELPNLHLSQPSQTKSCTIGSTETITCSVQSTVNDFYKLQWKDKTSAVLGTVSVQVPVTKCPDTFTGTCEAVDYPAFTQSITLNFITVQPGVKFNCTDSPWGLGTDGQTVVGSCPDGTLGEIYAICINNNWEVEDSCVFAPIKELFDQSQALQDPNGVPVLLTELSDITTTQQNNVTSSTATIEAVVAILEKLSKLSLGLTDKSMTDVLNTSSILTKDEAQKSWEKLNNKTYNNTAPRNQTKPDPASSRFLNNLETFTGKLTSLSAHIATDYILLNKTAFNSSFQEEYSGSVQIEIPESGLQNNTITVLTFESLHNVLPPIDKKNTSNLKINSKVVLVQSTGVNNVSFTFDLRNNSFFSPECVFWNFGLFNNSGGWDDQGCTLVNRTSNGVICNCNHLTSFSILMSPYATFSEYQQRVLDFITYAGVALSIGSLIVCLIIEAIVWRKVRKPRVSYMRHVTIVNIAVCLLNADIWFMIGAGISKAKHVPACTAAAFFIHLFYLALFFWMLVSGLLLFYRTVSVFDSGMRKGTMLAIGFSIGYGAPIIIAVVTIAATKGQEHYIQLNAVCWLNWNESKALLAFVIPALTIVVINFLILCVVIYKIIRRTTAATGVQGEERHVLVVIIRCLAFLTPFFGLTWCLGVATMVDIKDENSRFAVHASFAFFNSIQGFFILLFGTLLDKKVRQEISPSRLLSSGATRSTSGGATSSSSGLPFLRNRNGRRRDGYNISSNGNSSASNT